MLFPGWEVRMVKNCDLGLEKHFQDRGHSFSPYGPPSREITYISFILFRKIKLFKVLSNLIIVAACIAQFAIWKILYTWNEKHFQDRGHSFSPYGPPSREITYISFILFRKIKLFKVLSNLIIVAACIAQFAIWKILYTWNAISKFPNIFILRKFSLIFDNLEKNFIL